MELTSRILGDICDEVGGIIRTGPFGSQLHESDYKESGIPVVMPKNILAGVISTEDIAYIGDDDANRLSQHRLKRGDIVYGRRGDIGRRALITVRQSGWLCGTGCIRISLSDSVLDPGFLYYYLGQPNVIEWIYNQAIGATLPNLNTAIIRSIPIEYPPLPTQRKIAANLSAYDDLIENNTRRIKILKEMAQALYREWFVHFRFPGHEKVRMVDSPLGRIPEGWEAATLDKVIRFQNGRAVEVDDQGKFPLYGSNGVIGKTIDSRYHNGIVIGRVGAYCGSTFCCKSEFCASDNTIVAQAISEDLLCTELIYYILKNIDLGRNASGSAQPLLTQNVLKKIPVLIPDNIANKVFKNFLKSVNDEIINLYDRINNLQLTRDCLLPKLISGEFDVSDLDIEILNGAYYG